MLVKKKQKTRKRTSFTKTETRSPSSMCPDLASNRWFALQIPCRRVDFFNFLWHFFGLLNLAAVLEITQGLRMKVFENVFCELRAESSS